MRLLVLALFILQGVSESAAGAQNPTTFDTFLATYKASTATVRRQLAESFVQQRQAGDGIPIVEPDGRVVFFFLGDGDEKDVRLVGDFQTRSFYDIYWDEHGEEMTRAVPNDSLFFIRMKFEKDARLDYEFIVDGKHTNDPLNPRVVYSGTAPAEPGERVGTASELRMPASRPTTLATPRDVARGRLQTIEETWAQPKITLYLPPGYDSEKTYPVVYTADGGAWLKYIDLPVILDNLIADYEIDPVIAVMVETRKDRSAWYLFNPDYLTYLEKVVEHVDTHYSTRARAEERLHAGTSAGGRATLYAGFERSKLFKNLAMLSPSLTGPPHYFEPYFSGRKRPDPKLRVWLSAGTYEGYIYKDTQVMERYFEELGLEVETLYTHEGHSLGTWRNAVPAMLKYFFGNRIE